MTARITGYVTRAQAGLVAPKSVTALNGRRMEGVAVHHGAGATPTDHAKCLTTWRAYQRMHMSDPADPKVDIAYNYGVCRHGYVLEGRTWRYQPGANGIPWSSGYHPNRTNFAVCVIGSGNVVFSTVVTDAVEWCIQECRTKGNAGNRVRPHSFFASTGCPDTKLRAWAATIDGKPISTVPPATTDTIRLGDRGPHVATVQRLLIERGYDVGAAGADGVFGKDTDAAVRAFQASIPILVDGVVGPQTLAALSAPAKPATPPPPKEDYMPAISPEDWRKMTTGPEYAFYKNVLADDPNTAPRIPLGQAIENAGTAALRALKASKGDGPDIQPTGYVSGV